MKVFGKCKKCHVELPFATEANTRVEFAMQHGETIKIGCNSCRCENEFHVDELFTNKSNFPTIAFFTSFILVLLGTLYFIFFTESKYVVIAYGLSFTIYYILMKQDQVRVSSFSNFKLKGRGQR